jgi:hypothetical protein
MSLCSPLTFAEDIRPLFREKDISEMIAKRNFDLSKYEDVRPRAASILNRLETGDMPCDGAWPPEQVDLFRRWIDDGRQP